MKYHCSNCSYFYDEMCGDNDLGIESHTFFDDLPNDFFCPFCDTHKDDFVVLKENINQPIDINKLTKIESEHFPIYEIKNDILKFEIGQIEHPNEQNHYIYKVGLFDESGDLIDEKKINVGKSFSGEFNIEYLDIFELRTYCSRDGIFSTGFIQTCE